MPMSIGDVILAKYGYGSDLSRIVDPRGLLVGILFLDGVLE